MPDFTPYIPYHDLLWVPVVVVCVARPHRLLAAGFVLCCLVMLRMQEELLAEFDLAAHGIPGFSMESRPYYRGMIVYAIWFVLYILMSMTSKQSERVIYLAASISLFFMAFISSMLVMSL